MPPKPSQHIPSTGWVAPKRWCSLQASGSGLRLPPHLHHVTAGSTAQSSPSRQHLKYSLGERDAKHGLAREPWLGPLNAMLGYTEEPRSHPEAWSSISRTK